MPHIGYITFPDDDDKEIFALANWVTSSDPFALVAEGIVIETNEPNPKDKNILKCNLPD